MGTPDINKILRADSRSCARGAPMGDTDRIARPRQGFGDAPLKAEGTTVSHDGSIYLYLQRVRLIDGDYGPDGTYWGGGSLPLWCAFNGDNAEHRAGHGTRIYVRAKDRTLAKREVLKKQPNTRFYR